MIKAKSCIIQGKNISLQLRTKAQLQGVAMGDALAYDFYDGEYMGVTMLFLVPKGTAPSPRNCAATVSRLSTVFQLPIVFLIPPCPAYERQRLIEKNVYFVVSEKFAYLPMLLANELARKTKPARRLTPVAQYILLYNLEVESLEGLAACEMASKLPYSYENITLGLTCLADLHLCEKSSDGAKRKVIHFTAKGRELWEKAKPVMINPVDKLIYCDELHTDAAYPICSINALSHYSWLNSDQERMIMMSKPELKRLQELNLLEGANELDGSVIIEAWKYPVVAPLKMPQEYVDPLSMVLSLQDDDDPRVEGEVERVINEMIWKD